MRRFNGNRTTILGALIAFVAVVSLLVSSVRSTTSLCGMTIVAAADDSGQGDRGASVEKRAPIVDRALAASSSLEITKTPASQRVDRRGGNNSDDAPPSTSSTSPTGAIASRADMLDATRVATDWVFSIERPTRERARLMVFLN